MGDLSNSQTNPPKNNSVKVGLVAIIVLVLLGVIWGLIKGQSISNTVSFLVLTVGVGGVLLYSIRWVQRAYVREKVTEDSKAKKYITGVLTLVFLGTIFYDIRYPQVGGNSTANLIGLIAVILSVAISFWPVKKGQSN